MEMVPGKAPDPPDKPIQTASIKPSYSAIVKNKHQEIANLNPPVSPRTAKKAFTFNTDFAEPPLVADHPSETYQNHPAAVFFKSEIVALAAKLKWQLVGKFNRMPPWKEVKEYFQFLQLSGEYSIQWYNYRHILIKLSNEFDYAAVRRRPVIDFSANQRMRVLKWDINFSLEKESPVVPIWINFPELPNHLYEKSSLMKLAKTVGTPLHLDEPTSNYSRPSLPRVCIEYNCLHPPPNKIFVHFRDEVTGLNEEGYWQKIVFEKLPLYCSHCSHLGHDKADCRLISETQKNKGKSAEGNRDNAAPKGSNSYETNVNTREDKDTQKEANPPGKTHKSVDTQNQEKDLQKDGWEVARRRGGRGRSFFQGGRFIQGESSMAPKPTSQNPHTPPENNTQIIQEGAHETNLHPSPILVNQYPSSMEGGVKGNSQKFGLNPLLPIIIPEIEQPITAQENCTSNKEDNPSPELEGTVADGSSVEGEAQDGSCVREEGAAISAAREVDVVNVPKALGGPENDFSVAVVVSLPSPVRVDPILEGPDVQLKALPNSIASSSQIDKEKVTTYIDKDHLPLSVRKNMLLNKDAVAFVPRVTPLLHLPMVHYPTGHYSFHGDGYDLDEMVPSAEDDALSREICSSEASFQSEYYQQDEDFEDDFTVHPPRRRGKSCESHNFSPPVTRSKGFKIPNQKKKLRIRG